MIKKKVERGRQSMKKKNGEKVPALSELEKQETVAEEGNAEISVEAAEKEAVQEAQTTEVLPETLPDQTYKVLEEKMAALEAEARQMRAEIGKLKDHRGNIKKRAYKEFLDSPVLGELTDIYLENAGKAELYDRVREYLDLHSKERPAVRAELSAGMEKFRAEGLTSLAAASGILSVAGLVYAAMGTGIGILVVLFAVLILVSAAVWLKSEKYMMLRCMIVYIQSVLEKP